MTPLSNHSGGIIFRGSSWAARRRAWPVHCFSVTAREWQDFLLALAPVRFARERVATPSERRRAAASERVSESESGEKKVQSGARETQFCADRLEFRDSGSSVAFQTASEQHAFSAEQK